MRSLLPYLVAGIVTGSLYGMAGLGLVLAYRTSGVFNFGHGAVAAGAAFTFYSLHYTHGWPWPLAAVLTILAFAAVVGWVMERITRGLGDVPEAVVVLTTVGVLLAVEGLLFLLYGNSTRPFPEFLPTSGFTLGGVKVSWAQTISVVIATSSAVALYLFLQFSRLGVAMRAVVDNQTLTSLCGKKPLRISQSAWAISCGFAALSGILLAPTLNLDANLLTLLVIQAFGACAVGLFSSLPLTYAGGLGLGIAASLATKFFTDRPWNGIPPTVPFLILVAVLVCVPARRFPSRRASLRSLVPEITPMPPTRAVLAGVGSLVALAVVPVAVGNKLPVWIAGVTHVLVFASIGLLVWISGQISLCQASFLALGATTMGHLTNGAGLPWGLGLLLAGLLTVPIGLVVAIPAIRLSGVYLALATFGFAVLMQQVMYPSGWMFGFTLQASAPRPHLGSLDGTNDTTFYYIVLVIVALSVTAIIALCRSRLGRLLRAMAETPTMLATHGVSVSTSRLLVFSISAFFAGIAGGLQVSQFGTVSSLNYVPLQSLLFLAVLAIFGTRLLRSSILAAASIAVIPRYAAEISALAFLNDTDRQMLTFGAVAILAGVLTARRREFIVWLSARAGSTPPSGQRARPTRLAAARPAARATVSAGAVR